MKEVGQSVIFKNLGLNQNSILNLFFKIGFNLGFSMDYFVGCKRNYLTSRGITGVNWISTELIFMLRPWRFTGKNFEVVYCVTIKQWLSNDDCLFTSWNPTYPPPHDSLGLHNRRKQNAFSSSCFRHHLFSPLRHLSPHHGFFFWNDENSRWFRMF